MNEDSRRVLELLAAGKINAVEAEQLLQALKDGDSGTKSGADDPKPKASQDSTAPKYLRVEVTPVPGGGSRHKGIVNIKLPLGFLKSGIKLAAIMPDQVQGRLNGHLRDRGFNFDVGRMKPDDVDALIASLKELQLDVDSDCEKVRIFCE